MKKIIEYQTLYLYNPNLDLLIYNLVETELELGINKNGVFNSHSWILR